MKYFFPGSLATTAQKLIKLGFFDTVLHDMNESDKKSYLANRDNC